MKCHSKLVFLKKKKKKKNGQKKGNFQSPKVNLNDDVESTFTTCISFRVQIGSACIISTFRGV